VATWNVAWFGDETNSSSRKSQIQMPFKKEAVKTYQQLDADYVKKFLMTFICSNG
jgi:hypothetical protein